jgi:transcriptional regulator with XRE-family HTH domain
LKIGDFIKQYRDANNLSQREFAKRCNVSNGYISMLEEGKNPKTNEPIVPTLATYGKIANAMGMTVNDLFSRIADMPITVSSIKNTPDENNLTEGEKEFLELFRMLPDEEQQLYLEMLRARLNARTKGQAQS